MTYPYRCTTGNLRKFRRALSPLGLLFNKSSDAISSHKLSVEEIWNLIHGEWERLQKCATALSILNIDTIRIMIVSFKMAEFMLTDEEKEKDVFFFFFNYYKSAWSCAHALSELVLCMRKRTMRRININLVYFLNNLYFVWTPLFPCHDPMPMCICLNSGLDYINHGEKYLQTTSVYVHTFDGIRKAHTIHNNMLAWWPTGVHLGPVA